MIRLICLDVDGTLVGSSGAPSAAVWDAAQRAVRRGQRLAMCTARVALGESLEWARDLDPDGWHAFHNGAALVNPSIDDDRVVTIDAAHIGQIGASAAANGWVCEFYSSRELAVDSDHSFAIDHAHLLGIDHVRRRVTDLTGPVVRAQVMTPIDDAPAVLHAVPNELSAAVATSPLMPGVALVSITAAGIDKGFAVRALARQVGCDIAEVMMVGDGQNDLPAFAAAGVSVAMGNADPTCVAVASHQVAHVDSDGAAQAIDLAGTL